MKIEYLPEISAEEPDDDLIRIFDFDRHQAKALYDAISRNLLEQKRPLELSALGFIEPVNCQLTLSLADMDAGISKVVDDHFECRLTARAYEEMNELILPFCSGSNGHQWLYDLPAELTTTEFLFSPSGKW